MSEDQKGEDEQVAVATDTPAKFENLQSDSINQEHEGELDVVLDIPVLMTVEIGSANITVRNLLRLNQGSVVELDRLAGEALDIKVNGTLVAHGEVVVINSKFGIRITDVISTAERIEKLR